MFRKFWFLALVIAPPFALAQQVQPAESKPEPQGRILDESTKRMLDRSQSYVEQDGDGRFHLNANGGHQHVYMARIGKDGKVETFCAESIHAAEQFLSGRELAEVPR